jgi:mono/diheme cytochrome c family protein
MKTVPALVLVLFASTAGAAEQKADLKAIGQGRALFRQYCSSCHGVDGKGAGPSAEALKTAPPDLTALAKDGKFDEAGVRTWIDGTHATSAHGGRDMPVWGRVFAKAGERASAGGAQTDIWMLVSYLESIQAPTASK